MRGLRLPGPTLPAILLPIAAIGYVSSPPRGPDAIRHESDAALALLKKAARTCCDARTFEAEGTFRTRSSSGHETVHVRWAFGPNGEYRFDRGSVSVFHDTEHVGMADEQKNHYAVVPTRTYQPRQAPHNRYPGDMIMATGIIAIGMTYPIAGMRLLGNDFIDSLLPDGMRLRFARDERVAGHICRKIIGQVPHEAGRAVFWVDRELGVIRKWQQGGVAEYMSCTFDRITIDHAVPPHVFEIPPRVFERAKQQAARDAN